MTLLQYFSVDIPTHTLLLAQMERIRNMERSTDSSGIGVRKHGERIRRGEEVGAATQNFNLFHVTVEDTVVRCGHNAVPDSVQTVLLDYEDT